MYAVGIRVVGLVACVILFLFGAKGQEVAADSIRMGKILAPVEVSATRLDGYSNASGYIVRQVTSGAARHLPERVRPRYAELH